MSADAAAGEPLPRLCCLEKGPNGYGFHLHGEKGKVGQFIRLVEPGSPAEKSGLLAGDRLVEVNGENVEKETHQQVVSRIRGALNAVRLLVVDPETDEHLKKLGVPIREDLLRSQKSEQAEPPAAADAQATDQNEAEKSHLERRELRPRLCTMKKGPNGYGFNLHSDKSKPGQFIRAVDPDSPAEASGLRAQDRIVEVNGVCMEGKQHGDVVSAIKAGGDEAKLLVVDKETDEFFKKCKVIPSQEHLDGPLPEPFTNGEIQKESSREALVEAASESPRPALVRSASSDTSEELNSQDSPKRQESTEPSSTSSSSDPILDFNISLAVAKERAHQKRSSKRAPQMDWSKKNELFSNL
ncbi:Na(+)/H(+) exchange regulatory cofactor NHE-RF1 [Cricetulus griseus]|uniref:Na(+)/H(+) exchange regulatory cofactor NHE-RF n=1 Tax=Cricetulus griseus TaxID=10029 RepID=G3GTH2_CRIGR|nr:Na(+)/H(+) exchange regulatory cofactor NHE-RF1 [Cricetulus griseus]XP_027281535.1 Na(+)/H(+) exchange regulatory cofactor NHE-RF1 [Cricetulus griseus]EGV92378.1 Na(+)/H(+) exchange regulatory cofactor NHE-RF1 [Cricetulus griseus]